MNVNTNEEGHVDLDTGAENEEIQVDESAAARSAELVAPQVAEVQPQLLLAGKSRRVWRQGILMQTILGPPRSLAPYRRPRRLS